MTFWNATSTVSESWWNCSPYSRDWFVPYVDVSNLYASTPVKKTPPRKEDFPAMTDEEFGEAFSELLFGDQPSKEADTHD